jgi:hypothetical protein
MGINQYEPKNWRLLIIHFCRRGLGLGGEGNAESLVTEGIVSSNGKEEG